MRCFTEKSMSFRVMMRIGAKSGSLWTLFHSVLCTRANPEETGCCETCVVDNLLELWAWQDDLLACTKDHVTVVPAFVLRDAASFNRRIMARMNELDFQVLAVGKVHFIHHAVLLGNCCMRKFIGLTPLRRS